MKIRVTLMTENNSTVDGSKEDIEKLACKAWQGFFDLFTVRMTDKVIVEKCELIEEKENEKNS